MDVQAVWHRAELYTRDQASAWCKDHDFTTDVYRSREEDGQVTHHIHPQFDTAEAVEGSWRTLSDDFPAGVSVSICERKKSMQSKIVESEVSKGLSDADLEKGVPFVVSSGAYDRVQDRVLPKGLINKREFEQNAPALYGHDHMSLIGGWKNLREEGGKLIADLVLAAKGTSALVDAARELVKQGFLKAASIGFQPVEAERNKKGGSDYIKWSLHEISLVAVPCNQEALAIAKSFGADPAKVFPSESIRSLSRADSSVAKETVALLDATLKRNTQFREKRS